VKFPPVKLSGILLVFFIIGLLMTIWSVVTLIDMVNAINEEAEYVTFDKGAYYLFGGGLFFVVMSLGSYLSFFIHDSWAKTYTKSIGLSMVACLILVFIIPNIVHSYISQNLKSTGYAICEAKSSQWLHVKTIVYSKGKNCE
jgi:hypothetical protein